ncbi:hypothetical protein CBW56_14250 [Denitratisoma oestradiolicum]|nr:hypothetical protein CBW56_14250 [Denitratisoma oestradiolicum]
MQNAVGGLGVVFLVWLAVHWATGHPNSDRFVGLIGASVTCMLFALLSETSDFVFDAGTRRLAWSRRVGLRHRSGMVPFEEIEQVVVRTVLGGDAVAPSQRLVLLTRAGELPLTASYTPGDEHEANAERLRAFLGRSQGDAFSASVENLVSAGRDMDAIRELRLARGISLSEAHDEVARIRANAHDRQPPPRPLPVRQKVKHGPGQG